MGSLLRIVRQFEINAARLFEVYGRAQAHQQELRRHSTARISVILLLLAFGVSVAPLSAISGQPTLPGANGYVAEQPNLADIVISTVEQRIIRDYYARSYSEWEAQGGKTKNKQKGLPPGLAKKGTLPPGLQKQLARNGHLPTGLEKRYLPNDLLVQLQPRPPGYEFLIADDRILLVQSATNVILDMLEVAAARVH